MEAEIFDEEFWANYLNSDVELEPEFDSFVVDEPEPKTREIYFPVPDLNPGIEKEILEFFTHPLVNKLEPQSSQKIPEELVALAVPIAPAVSAAATPNVSPVTNPAEEPPKQTLVSTTEQTLVSTTEQNNFGQLSSAYQFAAFMANQYFPPTFLMQPPIPAPITSPIAAPAPLSTCKARRSLSPTGEEPPLKRKQIALNFKFGAEEPKLPKKPIYLIRNLPESKRCSVYYSFQIIKEPSRKAEIKSFPTTMCCKDSSKPLTTLKMPNIIMVNIRQMDVKFVGFSNDPKDYNIELSSEQNSLFDVVTIYYKNRADIKQIKSRRYEDFIDSLNNVEAQSVNAYLMRKCKNFTPSMIVKSRKATSILNTVLHLCDQDIAAADFLGKYFDYMDYRHLGLLAQKMNVPLITKIMDSTCLFTREFIRENFVRYIVLTGPTDFGKIDYLIHVCGLKIRISSQEIIDSPTSLFVVNWLWNNNVDLREVLNSAFHYDSTSCDFIKHHTIITRLLSLGVKVGKNNNTFRAIVARNDAWAFEHFLYAGHEIDEENIATIASSASIDIFDFMHQMNLIDNTNVTYFIKYAGIRAFNWFLTHYSLSLQRIYDILSKKGDKKMCQWFEKKYKFTFIESY
jgi:hypothetical protein